MKRVDGVRSPEEPGGGGQARGPQHYPQECHRLSAEPHQRGADHHHPPPPQPPADTPVRARGRGTRGTRVHDHASVKCMLMPAQGVRFFCLGLTPRFFFCVLSYGFYSDEFQHIQTYTHANIHSHSHSIPFTLSFPLNRLSV